MIRRRRFSALTAAFSRSPFVRFLAVGAAGTVTNSAFFFVAVDKLGMTPTVGSIGGFALAVSQNYLLNQRWSFVPDGSSRRLSLLRYVKFVVSSSGALATNLIVLHLLLGALSFRFATVPQLIGIACGAIVNYVASRYFVFLKSRRRTHESGDEVDRGKKIQALVYRRWPLVLLGYVLASSLYFGSQFLLLHNWDMLVRLLNAEHLFHGGYYFEPERALLESVLIGVLTYPFGAAAVYVFIVIGDLLLLTSLVRLSRVFDFNVLIGPVLVLNPFFLMYGVMNGSEIYLLSFLFLMMAETRRKSALSGIYLALAFLSKYDALYYGVILFFFIGEIGLRRGLVKILTSLSLFVVSLIPYFLYNLLNYRNIFFTFALAYLNFGVEVKPLSYFIYSGLFELALPAVLVAAIVLLRGSGVFRLEGKRRSDFLMLGTAFFVGLYIYYKTHDLMVGGLGTYRWAVIPLSCSMIFVAMLLSRRDLPLVLWTSVVFFSSATILLVGSYTRSLPGNREAESAVAAVHALFGDRPCTVYSNDWVVLDAHGLPAAPQPKYLPAEPNHPIVDLGRTDTSYPLLYARGNVYVYGDPLECTYTPVNVNFLSRENAIRRHELVDPLPADPCYWLFGIKPRIASLRQGCTVASVAMDTVLPRASN